MSDGSPAQDLSAPPGRDRGPVVAEEESQQIAAIFRVLADPGRVRLILALLSAGELGVGELAAATGLSETACSHSLRLLRTERIVRYRKDGRRVLYALDDDHVRTLLDVARDHVHHG